MKNDGITLIAHAGSYGGIATLLNHFSRVLFTVANVRRVILFHVESGVICRGDSFAEVEHRFAMPHLLSCYSILAPLSLPLGFIRELWLTLRYSWWQSSRHLVIISHDPNAFWGFVLRSRYATYCLYVTPAPAKNSYKRFIIALWRIFLASMIKNKLHNGRLKLVTPTEFAAKEWAGYLRINASSIEIMPSPPFLLRHEPGLIIDMQAVNPSMQLVRIAHSMGKKLVISVGHMEDYKNPHCWVRLVSALGQSFNEIVFVWVGDGTLFDEVQLVARKSTNVILTGRLNQEDLQELYANAWIFLHPANRESQGIVVMDALTYGLPVILNDREALPGLIKGYKAGYVMDFNAAEAGESLQAIIRELLDNEIYATCRSSAFMLAKERYSYDDWIAKIEAISCKWRV